MAHKTTRDRIMKEGKLCKLGAGLVVYSEGKVLLLHRGPHSRNPGKWGLPGGNMDANDSDLFETALRESQEEMGGYLKGLQVTGKITTLRGKHLDKRYDVFVVHIAAEEQARFTPVLNEEHVDWKWFPVLSLESEKHLHPVVKIMVTQHRSEFAKATVETITT